MSRSHQSPKPISGMIRMRLRGLPEDNAAAVIALGQLFHIRSDGGNVDLSLERTPEKFRYVHAHIPDPKRVGCVLCGCHEDCEGTCAFMTNPFAALLCTTCAETIADLVDEWDD